MIRYRFLSVAEEEMTEAAAFYEARTHGLGDDFLDDVQQVIARLRVHPETGVKVADALRSTLLRRFPFNLIYSLEPGELLIVSVAHHRRRPGYWRTRMESK
jgi:plasmid stabilization system protein ParE